MTFNPEPMGSHRCDQGNLIDLHPFRRDKLMLLLCNMTNETKLTYKI